MTRLVGINSSGYVLEEEDGRRSFVNAIAGFDPITCPIGPIEACSGPLAPLTQAQLDSIYAQGIQGDVALALLQGDVDRVVNVIGPFGDAAISTLNQTGIQRLSPTLGMFTLNPDLGIATAITQLGLAPAIQLTGLADEIQSELAQSTNYLYSSGELNEYRPDPGSLSDINQYQRYAMALASTEKYAPLVEEFRSKSMSLLDDLGLGGFVSPTLAPNTNYSFPTFGQTTSPYDLPDNPYTPTGYVPPVESSGGILDSIGGALGSLGTAVINNLPQILQLGAQTGLIRGTVGEALGYQPVLSSSVAPMTSLADPCGQFSGFEYALCRAQQIVMQNANPYVLPEAPADACAGITDDYQRFLCEVNNKASGGSGMTMPISPAQLAASSGQCGRRSTTVVNVMTAPGIFRLGCGGFKPVSKVIAERMDGTRDLFVRVGQIASPSPRVLKRFAKRWAKEAGLTVGTRGHSRRRTYRRRRPR